MQRFIENSTPLYDLKIIIVDHYFILAMSDLSLTTIVGSYSQSPIVGDIKYSQKESRAELCTPKTTAIELAEGENASLNLFYSIIFQRFISILKTDTYKN